MVQICNEFLLHDHKKTWSNATYCFMDLESIKLSEVSQREKDRHGLTSLKCLYKEI